MTVNSGRISDEKTIFQEGIKSYLDNEEGLTSRHDKPQVLLAENNLIFAMSLINQLKSYGVNCDLAYEPEEAL